jgi:hypothetical protein
LTKDENRDISDFLTASTNGVNMRRYLAIIPVLVAAMSATSAYADPVTYDFSVFSSYYFLGGSQINASGPVVTFQVTGDTSNIVPDASLSGASEITATTAEILVNGSFFSTVTDPIIVIDDPSSSTIGLVDTSADIMDITSSSLSGVSLSDNTAVLSGVASYGGSNPFIGTTPEGLFQLFSPDGVDFYSATVTAPGDGGGGLNGIPGLTPTPEPSPMLLLGTGLLGLAVVLFRKARTGMVFNA